MLWRIWDESKRLYVIIMLNPSTADHEANDNTISVVITRAKQAGFGGILVVNAFAWRATEPSEMKKAGKPVGIHNDHAIMLAISTQDSFLLCAWGPPAAHLDRNKELRCLIKKSGAKPHALKLSKNGEPEHPLYKKYELEPQPWEFSGSKT